MEATAIAATANAIAKLLNDVNMVVSLLGSAPVLPTTRDRDTRSGIRIVDEAARNFETKHRRAECGQRAICPVADLTVQPSMESDERGRDNRLKRRRLHCMKCSPRNRDRCKFRTKQILLAVAFIRKTLLSQRSTRPPRRASYAAGRLPEARIPRRGIRMRLPGKRIVPLMDRRCRRKRNITA